MIKKIWWKIVNDSLKDRAIINFTLCFLSITFPMIQHVREHSRVQGRALKTSRADIMCHILHFFLSIISSIITHFPLIEILMRLIGKQESQFFCSFNFLIFHINLDFNFTANKKKILQVRSERGRKKLWKTRSKLFNCRLNCLLLCC